MCEIFMKYRGEIEKYCEESNLSISKLFSSPVSYNNEKFVFALYHDPKKGKQGLMDETPMSVTLAIFIENGTLRFEQTEHTHKYLSELEPAYA